MFEQTLLELSARGQRRGWSVALSFVLQCLCVGFLILVPLMYTEGVPRLPWDRVMIQPPAGQASAPGTRVPPRPRPSQLPPPTDRLVAPRDIPVSVAMVDDRTEAPVASEMTCCSVVGAIPIGDSRSSFVDSLIRGIGSNPPPPPPHVRRQVVTQRVGGDVQQAKAIYQPKPQYPQLARQARIFGVVRLEAIISRDGTIQSLRLVEGHPLLVQAAMEAVRQWRYKPTLLNGEPVEVATTIDVNFTLAQ